MIQPQRMSDLMQDRHEAVLANIGIGEGGVAGIEPNGPLDLLPGIGVGAGCARIGSVDVGNTSGAVTEANVGRVGIGRRSNTG